jgi:hypothetical protein
MVLEEYKDRATKHIPTTVDDTYKPLGAEDMMERTYFFVNGNAFRCWGEFNKMPTVTWEQVHKGWSLTIGSLYRKLGDGSYEQMPVNISLSFAVINEVLVCFYESDSMVTDWKLVEDYVLKYVKTYDRGSRITKTNEINVWHCISYCIDQRELFADNITFTK